VEVQSGALKGALDSLEAQNARPVAIETAPKNMPLAVASIALMVSASRSASALMAADKSSEALNMAAYGFLIMNVTGGAGGILNMVFPGRAYWVQVMLREITYTIGTTLLLIGLCAVADQGGFWTDNNHSVPRFMLLVLGFVHTFVKNFYHASLDGFVQIVLFGTASTLLCKGWQLGNLSVLGAAICQVLASVLQTRAFIPKALLRTEEMALLLMAGSCALLAGPLVEYHSSSQDGTGTLL
jgi:hypothetical protein